MQHPLSVSLLSAQWLHYRILLRHLLHLLHQHLFLGTCLVKQASTTVNRRGHALLAQLVKRPPQETSSAPFVQQVLTLTQDPLETLPPAQTATQVPTRWLAHHRALLAVQASTPLHDRLSAQLVINVLVLSTKRQLALLHPMQSAMNAQHVLAQSTTAHSALLLRMQSAQLALPAQLHNTGSLHALDHPILSANHARRALALNTGHPHALPQLIQSAQHARFATALRTLKLHRVRYQATLSAR